MQHRGHESTTPTSSTSAATPARPASPPRPRRLRAAKQDPPSPGPTSREAAERIVALADGLSRPDRALLEAIYERGLSAAECARMAGRDVRWMQRRVKRLLTRLADPRYAFVYARHRHWPTFRRRVARAIFLEGRSRRRTARELGVSLHRVRREADRVAAMADAAAELYEETRHPARLTGFACPGSASADHTRTAAPDAGRRWDEEDAIGGLPAGDDDCDPDDALHADRRARLDDDNDPFGSRRPFHNRHEDDDDDDDPFDDFD